MTLKDRKTGSIKSSELHGLELGNEKDRVSESR